MGKLTVVFVLTLVVFGVALLAMWRRGQKPIVLGRELAKAEAAESARVRDGRSGPSPMSGATYQRRDHSLIVPVWNRLDEEIGELTRTFRSGNDEERTATRSAISMDEIHTMIAFARRATVFTLRSRDRQLAVDGLTALAMVEAARCDPRDLKWALVLLHHASTRIGADTEALLADAAALGDPTFRSMIDSLLELPVDERGLLEEWGFAEIETSAGPGLIRSGGEPYESRRDLTSLIQVVAGLVSADGERAEPEIATALPEFWFSTEDRDGGLFREARAGVSAVASVSAASRRYCPNPLQCDQMLSVYLAETRDAATAATLTEFLRPNVSGGLVTGFAEGEIFCLIGARAIRVGVQSIETPESLANLAEKVRSVMRANGSS